LGDRDLDIDRFAAHPFQVDLGETLVTEPGSHLVVGEDGAVLPFRGLVKVDGEVLHQCSLELLLNPRQNTPRGLSDLEHARMSIVVDRVSVDSEAGFWLLREEVFDELTHYCRPRTAARRRAQRPATR